MAPINSSLLGHCWHVGLLHHCVSVFWRIVSYSCQEHWSGNQQYVCQDRLYLSSFRSIIGKLGDND